MTELKQVMAKWLVDAKFENQTKFDQMNTSMDKICNMLQNLTSQQHNNDSSSDNCHEQPHDKQHAPPQLPSWLPHTPPGFLKLISLLWWKMHEGVALPVRTIISPQWDSTRIQSSSYIYPFIAYNYCAFQWHLNYMCYKFDIYPRCSQYIIDVTPHFGEA